MASKVGLKEEEYNNLVNTIASEHENGLAQLEEAIAKLSALNSSSGGISTEKLSPQINNVLSELQNIKGRIENVYAAHEEVISSFQNAIANYDTSC